MTESRREGRFHAPVLDSNPFNTPTCKQFEVAVGAYSAAIADLRARLLPDPRRATLMNQTRLAQNALVVAMYLGPLRLDAGMGTVKRRVVLGLCAGLMLLAAAALLRLRVAISLAAEEREEGRGG